FASLAVMMTYFITLKLFTVHCSLFTKIIPATVASLILAFSTTFWEQAVIAEKYTLNAFFFTLLIFILLKWSEHRTSNTEHRTYLYLFAFILGLSFTHHFQTVYLVPGSIFFILAISWKNRKRFKAQSKKPSLLLILKTHISRFISLPSRLGLPLSLILKITLLFILPITLWIYLPLRANQHPILNWGDPSNLDNLIIHITGQTYGVYFSRLEASLHNLPSHLKFFPSQFSLYFLWIGLIAIPILLWRRLTIFIFFTLIFVANVIHSIRYTIVNIQDYYIPSFILVAILMGFGLSFITRLMPKFLKPIYILFLLLPLIPYYTNHFQNNRAKFYFAYDYGMNISNLLKEDAIIFSYGDYDTFPLYCLFYAEERRRDISPLCWTFLTCDWHIESIKRLHPEVLFPFNKIAIKELRYCDLQGVRRERLQKIISENFSRFPIYVNSGAKQEGGIEKSHFFLPEGLFFRLLEKGTDRDRLKIELERNLEFFLRGLNNKTIFKDRVASGIMSNYSLSYNERGNLWQGVDIDKAIFEYKNALAINPSYSSSKLNLGFAYLNAKDYEKAMGIFREMAKEDPDYNPSLIHYGLGQVYRNKGGVDEAIKEYKMALRVDPNNLLAKQMLEQIK
ncbi:MAG: DUF2723 domain-containing protein, partial [Proteobacteria bacterium]|nr:DUF2723 domain-containing protein [Pseudomonadota bacterium]MBU1705983.1 DUF2723 domain-containing protein [Patescibacteria group bacterium]